MKPILFELFGWKVPSYAVLMVLGYVAALALLMHLTKREPRVERAQVWDLFIVMVVSSIIGSKIGHVLFEAAGHKDEAGRPIANVFELLRDDPWHWARLGEAGYVWYGGMIGALLTAVVYFRRRPELDRWAYSDLFAPAIMIGASVGRLGCFLAGCCYGKPTDLPWAVKFPTKALPIHPTQLYDSGIALFVAGLLTWRFTQRKFAGENIALLLIFYPVLRSLTESFRGDGDRGGLGPLSTSQWLSIPLLVAGIAIYVSRSRAKGNGLGPPSSVPATRFQPMPRPRDR